MLTAALTTTTSLAGSSVASLPLPMLLLMDGRRTRAGEWPLSAAPPGAGAAAARDDYLVG